MDGVCRLLGYAAPDARSLADAVGAVQMATFCAMARLHDDGWGAAWVPAEGSPVRTQRSPRSGHQDPALDALTTATPARAGLVHLRLASSGMPVAPENTHPFLEDGTALAHNGAIKPVAQLEGLLPDAVRQRMRGSTDSERYAALVRHRAAELGDLAAGAASVVAQLATLFPSSSLNAVLLTERELVVVQASAGAHIPHEDFDASGLPEAELPADHRTGYYQLWRRRSPDGTVVFSSSGLRTDGWEPLAPGTVVAVDLRTLAERVVPVMSRTTARPPSARRVEAGAGALPWQSSRHDSHERAGGVRVGG